MSTNKNFLVKSHLNLEFNRFNKLVPPTPSILTTEHEVLDSSVFLNHSSPSPCQTCCQSPGPYHQLCPERDLHLATPAMRCVLKSSPSHCTPAVKCVKSSPSNACSSAVKCVLKSPHFISFKQMVVVWAYFRLSQKSYYCAFSIYTKRTIYCSKW